MPCSSCGSLDKVEVVTFDVRGRDVTRPLCATCKATMLERRRVRVGRRRGPGSLGRLGYALVSVGIAALVVLGALAVNDLRHGDDDKAVRCRMTETGMDCSR